MVTKLKYSEEGFTIVADDTADLLKVFDHVTEGPQVVEVRTGANVEGPSPWATPILYEPGETVLKRGEVYVCADDAPVSVGPMIGEELRTEPEWIKWNGGECPVDRLKNVEVKFRIGTTDNEEAAGYWDWSHGVTPLQADIIAYRVIA